MIAIVPLSIIHKSVIEITWFIYSNIPSHFNVMTGCFFTGNREELSYGRRLQRDQGRLPGEPGQGRRSTELPPRRDVEVPLLTVL